MITVTFESKNEMVGYLKTLGTSSSFVSLETETEVKMRKTGNPFVGTVKVVKRTGLINVDFVSSVRRRMAEIQKVAFSETEYVAGTTWYKHVQTAEGKALPLCVHKDDDRRFYLQYFPLRSHGEIYFLKGRQLSAEEVVQMETFITEKERKAFKPIVITLAIDSIRKMKARNITVLNETIDRIAQSYAKLQPAQPPIRKDWFSVAVLVSYCRDWELAKAMFPFSCPSKSPFNFNAGVGPTFLAPLGRPH